jgi:hypothetical protein
MHVVRNDCPHLHVVTGAAKATLDKDTVQEAANPEHTCKSASNSDDSKAASNISNALSPHQVRILQDVVGEGHSRGPKDSPVRISIF